MKLLQFVPEHLPTHRPDVTVLFGKSLPEHGITCDIIGKASASGNNDIEWPAKVMLAPTKGNRARRELGFWWLCLRTLLLAKPRDYACVQVRDMVTLGFVAMLLCRIKGIPFIYWMSYLMSEGRIERARSLGCAMGVKRYLAVAFKGYVEYWLLYRVVLPNARHVFVQSDGMQLHVAKTGLPNEKMTPVPMGTDIERILNPEIKAKRLNGWDSCPVIAYLGTLERLRSINILIDALHIVQRHHPKARLLLIGDAIEPSDVEMLRSRAKELGIAEQVHITGWLPPQEAWALLKGADVACSPFPRGEILDTNSPTKLPEYLALGIPCVGNDSPDQRKVLVESEAGWLVSWSAEDFARGIVQILDDLPSAQVRSANGLKYIQKERSYTQIGSRLAVVYKSILG